MNIAIIAHDKKKQLMIELCKEYSYISPKATKEDYFKIIQEEIEKTV